MWCNLKRKENKLMIKTLVCIDDDCLTTFETDYSAEAIEQCFDDSGYCVLQNLDKTKSYMVTPKSLLYAKTNFNA